MPFLVGRAIVVAVFLLVALARRAEAAEPLRLSVDSTPEAASCGGADVLRARIAERLGRDPFSESEAAPMRLDVRFARKRRAFTAEIALIDANGERRGGRTLEQEGSGCEALVTSVVFTVALLLEDLAPRTPEPARPANTPAREPEPEPAPLPPPEQVRPKIEPAPERIRLDASLAGAGALGGAPAPAVGGEIGFGLDRAHARLEVAARAWLPASGDGDVGVRTRLVYGRMAPCYGWVVASACGILAIGSISGNAVGAGVMESRSEAKLYAGAGAGLLSRVFLLRDLLFVRASVDLLFSVARAGFDVGDRRVWTVPLSALTGSVGLGIRLP